jgi:hypothetical protein
VVGVGAATLLVGALSAVVGAGTATASFGGANGALAFVADCGNGQQVWSVSDASTDNTCTSYTAETAGATDAMPYFSGSGATLYFASDRNGPWTIYSVPYPNASNVTSNGDGATALTDPGTSDDYAPTVSGDGGLMDFIRCANSGVCRLYTVPAPFATSTPVLQNTAVSLMAPNENTGDANRPVINPVNSNLVLYVGTDGHIHLWNISTKSDTDLSLLTGVGSASDEHPDWSPDGQAVVFDSSRTVGDNGESMTGQTGDTVYMMTGIFATDPATTANPAISTAPVPTVSPRWSSLSSSTFAGSSQIEPVFAPDTVGASDSAPMLAWVNVKTGSNVYLVAAGVSVNNPTTVDTTTATRSVNSMVAWQPISPCSLTGSSCSDTQTFEVTINPGTITMTTPYTASSPFVLPAMTLSSDGTYFQSSATFPKSTDGQIVVTSALAPAYAWTLSVSATPLTSGSNQIPASGLGLTSGALVNSTGSDAYLGAVSFTSIPALNPSPVDGPGTGPGLSTTPQSWAMSTAADGNADMDGTLTLYAATSTPAGTYSGTISFSVS